MKKILLVNSHLEIEKLVKGEMPPIGLGYIAAVLEREGFEVSILDLIICEDPRKSLQGCIKKFSPDIVGISFASANRFQAFEVARWVKEIDENILVVVGGPHITFTAEDTLKNVKEVDIVGRGEGEHVMLDIAMEKKLEDIKGISFRKNNRVIHNLTQPPIKNLDDLPIPAYHLFDMNRYKLIMPFIKNYEAATISTMRGCPYGCNFCSCTAMWGRYPRTLSPEKILENIRLLTDDYRVNSFYFIDETFTLHKRKCSELCQKIVDEKLDIRWMTDVRVNEVDRGILKSMKRAGCYMVAYGVESGNQKIIDKIGKSITLKQVLDCTKICGELGIKRKAFFTFGLPGDTKETIMETYNFRKKLEAEIKTMSVINIFPGTQVENIARINGCLVKDFSWSREFYEPYHLVFFTPSSVPLFYQPHLSKKELAFFYMKYIAEKKPISGQIKKAIKRTRSFNDMKAVLNYGVGYLKAKMT